MVFCKRRPARLTAARGRLGRQRRRMRERRTLLRRFANPAGRCRVAQHACRNPTDARRGCARASMTGAARPSCGEHLRAVPPASASRRRAASSAGVPLVCVLSSSARPPSFLIPRGDQRLTIPAAPASSGEGCRGAPVSFVHFSHERHDLLPHHSRRDPVPSRLRGRPHARLHGHQPHCARAHAGDP